MLAIIFVGGIALLSVANNTIISDLALKHSSEIGERYAAEIAGELNRGMATVEAVARAFGMMRRASVLDRAAYNDVMRALFEGDPRLFSMWAGFEPNAIDPDADHPDDIGSNEKGRFLAHWYREDGQIQVGVFEEPTDAGPSAEFYHRPKQSRKSVVTEPYWYKVGERTVLMVSLAAPVIVDRRFIGVVGLNLPLDRFSEDLDKVRPLETGTVSLISHKGVWAAFRLRDALGKPIAEHNPQFASIMPSIEAGESHEFHSEDGVPGSRIQNFLRPITIGATGTPWGLLVGIPLDKVYEPSVMIQNWTLAGGTVTLVILTGVLSLVGLIVVRKPLAKAVTVIDRLAGGDYTVEVTDADRRDEIGQVNRALQIFQKNIMHIAELEQERRLQEEQVAVRRREEMGQLADAFEAALSGIVSAVSTGAGQLQSNACSLTGIAEEASRQCMAVASASEEATTSVQTVATAAEDLVTSISEVTRQIDLSAGIARAAANQAERTNGTVEGLVAAAQRIGDVTGFIQQIASQTNLLALNATIEAARAGDAGKGFAVVASEVKNLAGQTAKATDDIRLQIQQMQEATSGAVSAIRDIGRMITTINESVTSVASGAERQGSATSEISRNIQQAAEGTRDVSRNITGVMQASGETGRMALDVLRASEDLAGQAAHLQSEVQTFIDKIRAT